MKRPSSTENFDENPTEQQILDDYFKKYQKALEIFLKFKKKSDEDIKETLSQYATCPTVDDIKSAQKNPTLLMATMSNSASRPEGNASSLDFKRIVIQFFWNKYREFAIDFVVRSADSLSENFFLDLGVMRKLFDAIKFGSIPNSIISYEDYIMSYEIYGGFGAIYQYAGRNNRGGLGKSGSKSETVVYKSDRDKFGTRHCWHSIFESLDTYLNNEIKSLNCPHSFEDKLGDTRIILNVDISSQDKQQLYSILKKLQEDENYAVIDVHADNCGGYMVSAITHPKYSRLDICEPTCDYTPYSIEKFYIIDLVSGDLKAPVSKSQQLISLSLGSVMKFTTYIRNTSEKNSSQFIPVILEDESTQIQPGFIYIKFNLEKTGFVFSAYDFEQGKVLPHEPLDTFRGKMPSSLSMEILNEATLKSEIIKAALEKNKNICDELTSLFPTIVCSHDSVAHQDWLLILNVVLNKLIAIPKGENNNEVFLQKLGEFMYLYINIMPYQLGSAAIGEWLMYGLAKSRGINLGPLNSAHLSWDFSAFASISPEAYGQHFQTFFANQAGVKNQSSAAFFQESGKAQAAQSSDPNNSDHQMKH